MERVRKKVGRKQGVAHTWSQCLTPVTGGLAVVNHEIVVKAPRMCTENVRQWSHGAHVKASAGDILQCACWDEIF